MEIIERVLHVLEQKGNKMSELADHLGVGSSTVANWKARKTDPPAKFIIPICEFLDDKLEEGRQEWINEAARFSLGLGILLEAAKTPLTVKKAGKAHRKTKGGKKNKGEWATRRVILGRMATRYYGQSPAGGKLDKDGKVLSRTMVSGHLRYQPYGPNREKRKWIWIDTYESRRWTSAKTKIEVNEE